MPPTVSVVTLCYGDRSAFLRPRIESILNQTFTDFEWVIVDDGCVPATKAELRLLARNPRVKTIIQHPQPLGISRSYNEAIAACEGEYILRAEDDDTAEPSLIEKLVAVFQRFSAVGLVYCTARLIDDDGRDCGLIGDAEAPRQRRVLRSSWVRPGIEVFREMMVEGSYVFGCSQMIRRTCFQELGVYATDLAMSADLDFVYRVALAHDIGYVAEPLVGYRIHPGSYTQGRLNPGRIHEYYLVYERALECGRRRGVPLEEDWKSDALTLRGKLVFLGLLECLRERKPGMCKDIVGAARSHDPHFMWNLARGLCLAVRDGIERRMERRG